MPRWIAHAEKRREGTRALGAPTYRELYERFGFPLEELAAQARALPGRDGGAPRRRLRPASCAGASASRSRRRARHDVLRAFRGSDWDEGFPGDRMVPGARVDARRARNRPGRAGERPPRPRAAAAEEPARLLRPDRGSGARHARDQADGRAGRLARVLPRGRARRALRARLAATCRSSSGGSATTRSPRAGRCSSSTSSTTPPGSRAASTSPGRRTSRRSRRSASSTSSAATRGSSCTSSSCTATSSSSRCAAATSSCSHDATKIEPSPTDFLADVDEGFYCTCYLRAWAFHTQIESFLREELGRAWFTRPEAGSLLRELWAEGQRLTAAELLDQVAGAKLELAAVGERIEEEVTGMRRVVIAGAAGRDFHNFNVVYRGSDDVEVVAFTATQIPDIEGRVYPAALAGSRYPDGIPILPEEELADLVRRENVDEVVFAYSDVTHEHVMHVGSLALAAGADYALLGPRATMIPSEKPVVAVCAVRTGSGKSQTTRYVAAPAPRGGQARRRPPPSDAVRRPDAAGGAALRALRGPRRGRLHDRGARGVRAAPRRGQPRLRRASTTRRSSPAPRRRPT